MPKTSLKRSLPWASAAVALAMAVLFVPLASPQAGAKLWARNLPLESIRSHTDRASLLALPAEYRKTLFGRLGTATDRSAFWRSVIANFRESTDLADAQLATLARLETLFAPAYFETQRRDPGLDAEVAQVRDQILTSLGPEAEAYLFYAAGPSSISSAGLPFGERVRYLLRGSVPNWLRRIQGQVSPELAATTCDCNPEFSGDCVSHQNCASPFDCDVDETWPACGTAWAHPCTKLCSYDS